MTERIINLSGITRFLQNLDPRRLTEHRRVQQEENEQVLKKVIKVSKPIVGQIAHLDQSVWHPVNQFLGTQFEPAQLPIFRDKITSVDEVGRYFPEIVTPLTVTDGRIPVVKVEYDTRVNNLELLFALGQSRLVPLTGIIRTLGSILFFPKEDIEGGRTTLTAGLNSVKKGVSYRIEPHYTSGEDRDGEISYVTIQSFKLGTKGLDPLSRAVFYAFPGLSVKAGDPVAKSYNVLIEKKVR